MSICNRVKTRQSGVGLLELVIAIAVIGIVMSAMPQAITSAVGNSTDPMIRLQAINIASAYVEEIMLQSYRDPALPTGTPDSGCEADERTGGNPDRAKFDDVFDYDCISDAVVQNRAGEDSDGLGAYRVSVDISSDAATRIEGRDTRKIQVKVTLDGLIQPVILTAYRVKYD